MDVPDAASQRGGVLATEAAATSLVSGASAFGFGAHERVIAARHRAIALDDLKPFPLQ
jgi:hypothetical protein